MNKKQFFLIVVLTSVITCLLTLSILFITKSKEEQSASFENRSRPQFVNYLADSSAVVPDGLNFIYAAEVARPSVVHIKVTIDATATRRRSDDLFNFFGEEDPQAPESPYDMPSKPMASGSGVILSSDGYIVTNNHVVDHAEQIEVVLDDKRKYIGKVIGKDPTTDLALLKIEEKGLSFLSFGNSEKIKVGEWALAVGNPFELTSTVTAGIISAKGRNLHLIRDNNNLQIESFLQTDAVVNPGNSGGALVNLKGELIGINTAILGGFGGTYTGYSFAIPSILVKKVVEDLLKYGEVQRGLLGVEIREIDAQLKEEKGLTRLDGAYIGRVQEGSAAEKANLKAGDIVIAINGEKVQTVNDLQQKVALHRPGDEIRITYIRDKKEYTAKAILRNRTGNTSVIQKESEPSISKKLGASFRELTSKEKDKFKIKTGVLIDKIQSGKLYDAGIKEGFVILFINKHVVRSVKELESIISNSSGGILIEGVYMDGSEGVYAINIK